MSVLVESRSLDGECIELLSACETASPKNMTSWDSLLSWLQQFR